MPDVASTPEAPPARACHECGARLDERQAICVECGAAVTEPRTRARRTARALKPLSLAAFAVLVVTSAAYGLTASAGRDSGNLGAVAVAPTPAAPGAPAPPEAPAPEAPTPTTTAPAPPAPTDTTPAPEPKPPPSDPSPSPSPAAKPSSTPAPSSPSPAPSTPAPSHTPSKPAKHGHSRGGENTHAAGDKPYSATLYDPYADGKADEHAKQAHRAVDGNDKTAWTTADHPDGLGKPGVGLVVEASGYQSYSALAIETATPGFSVEVYSTTESDPPEGGPDQPGWTRVGNAAKTKKQQSIELKGASADPQYLLVWITKLPARSERAGISEISLLP